MKQLTRALFVLLAALPLACGGQLLEDPYEMGKHYRLVRDVQKPTDPKRIEVLEIFWYGCPHCYQFEPHVNDWAAKKPADVDLVRMPASLGRPAGLVHSKAFYTAEALGVLDVMHPAIFEAMHKEYRSLDTQEAMRAFFQQKAGVKPQAFDDTFGGFAVDSRVRKAEMSLRDLGVSSVPAVVVGGKYITNAGMAGGYGEVFKVVEFLAEKLRRERKAQ